MLPTPSTSHVDYDRVYEPAEDSYLLLDTLSSESESAFLQKRFPRDAPSPLCLEVGTGSGVVLAFLTVNASRITGRSDVMTIGSDVNEFAADAAKQTALKAADDARRTDLGPGSFVDCILSDLTAAIKPGSIDILIFNPPYVPSESVPAMPTDSADTSSKDTFARDSNLLYLSTDGGIDGMEVTDRLLDQLPSVLSSRGVAYVLLCAGNKPDQVMQQIRSWPATNDVQWKVEKVGSSGRKAGWEKLCVIRIFRSLPDVARDE